MSQAPLRIAARHPAGCVRWSACRGALLESTRMHDARAPRGLHHQSSACACVRASAREPVSVWLRVSVRARACALWGGRSVHASRRAWACVGVRRPACRTSWSPPVSVRPTACARPAAQMPPTIRRPTHTCRRTAQHATSALYPWDTHRSTRSTSHARARLWISARVCTSTHPPTYLPS